jgi:outer membrane protein assembly factor BamE (lipoprotein component of BamABCDE complex)
MTTTLKMVAAIAVLLLFVGCVAAGHVKSGDPSLISVGMTKQEVAKKLGKPETVAADGQSETFGYILERPWWQDKPFRVKFVEGKVVSYEIVEH